MKFHADLFTQASKPGLFSVQGFSQTGGGIVKETHTDHQSALGVSNVYILPKCSILASES